MSVVKSARQIKLNWVCCQTTARFIKQAIPSAELVWARTKSIRYFTGTALAETHQDTLVFTLVNDMWWNVSQTTTANDFVLMVILIMHFYKGSAYQLEGMQYSLLVVVSGPQF